MDSRTASGQGWDTVIVGGGIHGCALALELAQSGQKVLVLERSIPGAEASTAAGGILGPHLECEGDSPFFRLCLNSLERYPSWLAQLQPSVSDLGFERCGGLMVAHNEAEAVALLDRSRLLSEIGSPQQWLPPDELSRQEPAIGPNRGALFLPHEARLNPRHLLPALVSAAKSQGVEFARDQVLAVEGGRPGRVIGEEHSYQGEAIALAAGAWTTTLPGVGLPQDAIQPARGQMLRLRPERGLARTILFSSKGYVVPRRDGSYLCGSTLEFEGFRKAVTEAGRHSIRALAGELLPGLQNAKELEAWCGFRPYTKDHLPLLGWDKHSRIFFSSGHYRNGILLAPVSAALVAQSILGQATELDLSPFSPDRLRTLSSVDDFKGVHLSL